MYKLAFAGLPAVFVGPVLTPTPAFSKPAFDKIVDSNTPQPGASFNFFFNYQDTPAIWGSTVVFRSDADKSVWTTILGDGNFQPVLDQTVPIPNMKLQIFSQDCGGPCIQIIDGNVVFEGESAASGNLVGIYTVPAAGYGGWSTWTRSRP